MKAFISLSKNDERFHTFFTEENVALAESLGEIVWNDTGRDYTKDDVAELIGDCDVYVTAWDCPKLDSVILDKAENLKLMVHLCGTVAPYASKEVWERGVRVISGNNYFAESVAEATVGYMITAQRNIPKYSRRFKEEKIWRAGDEYTNSLIGKTVGLVSYGAIAKHLVRMLSPFRVKIKVYDVKPLPEEDVKKYGLKQASLEEIFSSCDIVSLHTPHIKETHHLITEELLAMLPEDSLFVNTARGEIVDEEALARQLMKGRFRAILDVYEQEPPPSDSPLYTCENVILVPHMGGPTVNLRADITRDLLTEAAGFIDSGKELPNEITLAAASVMSLK